MVMMVYNNGDGDGDGDDEVMMIYGDGDDDSCNQVYREHRLLSLSSEGLLEVAAFKVF